MSDFNHLDTDENNDDKYENVISPAGQQPVIAPLSKYEIKMLRHPSECRWYRFLVVLNILIVLWGVFYLAADIYETFGEDSYYQRRLEGIDNGDAIEDGMTYAESQKINNYTYILILIIGVIVARELLYAQVRASAIRLSRGQFPDVYVLAEQYSRRLGLKKLPDIYIIQENGIMNAFSAAVFQKRYVQINVDLLEIAYRQYNDMASIGFVLAHELAHVKLKHVNIGYNYSILFSYLIPIFGSTLSRAREYSCDRIAQVVSGIDGVNAMMALSSGKHLYKNTDVNDYLATTQHVGGFWVWLVNLLSSHPILPKRIRALIVREIPGKLY